jgi:hypothetical protein
MLKKYLLLIFFLPIFSLNAQSLQITDFKSANSCDYLVICPDSFLSCGIKLASYRNSYLFDDVEKAMVVPLTTIKQVFPVNDTFPQAFSVWYALKYTTEHWIVKPKYVVLLGDDSVNVNGFDSLSKPPQSVGIMPTFINNASANKGKKDTTKIDTMYNYTDFPYLMIADATPPLIRTYNKYSNKSYLDATYHFALGRIPARTVQECTTYVNKVIRYEKASSRNSWCNRIILTADDATQGELPDPVQDVRPHQASSEYIAQYCFKGCFIDKTYLSSFTKTASGAHEQAKKHFFQAFNKGARYVVYFGHGHQDSLSDEGFLRACDTTFLTNDSMFPMFFSFTCDNGGFLRKSSKQMCHAFLFTSHGGCIAYIAAPVQTYAIFNERLADVIFSQIDSSGSLSVGKIIANTQLSPIYGTPNRSYEVFGDPAIKFTNNRFIFSNSIVPKKNGDVSCVTALSSSTTFPIKYRYQVSIRDSVTSLDGLSSMYLDDSLIAAYEGVSSDGRIITDIPGSAVTTKTFYTLYAWNDNAEFHLDTCIVSPTSVSAKTTIAARAEGFKFNRNILTISFPTLSSATTVSIALFTINGAQIKAVETPLVRGSAVLNIQSIHLPPGNYIFRATTEGFNTIGRFAFVQ